MASRRSPTGLAPIRTAQLRLGKTIQLLVQDGLPHVGTIYHEQQSLFGGMDVLPRLDPIEEANRERWEDLKAYCFLAGVTIKWSPVIGFSVFHLSTYTDGGPPFKAGRTQEGTIAKLRRAARVAVKISQKKAAAKSLQSST